MKEERNALQQKVFPKLRELCMANGTRFQAVDLRWGISGEAYLNQQTLKFCLNEIKRCQHVSPRPNFIVLLGDRYGWRPPPPEIPFEEFEAILKNLPDDNSEKKRRQKLLVNWYLRDDNAVPPVYCLQPRKEDYKAGEIWDPIEQEILIALRGAMKELPLNQTIKIKYFASVTEQEVIRGALEIPDNQEHVFCFFRKIENLPEDESTKNYMDLDENNKKDKDSFDRLQLLKRNLREELKDNVFDYKAEWTGDGISTTHIDDLCVDVYNSLAKIIKQEIAKLEKLDLLESEILEHNKFGYECAKNFLGRVDIIEKIRAYYSGTDNHPLAIYGDAGSGKTALMARTAEIIRDEHPKNEIILRFIGATPSSTIGRGLLGSICHQISRCYGRDESRIPMDYKKLVQVFPNLLTLATEEKPLTIIIDALDQLSIIDESRNLVWLPQELPPYVQIIISTLPSDCLSVLEQKIPTTNLLKLDLMPANKGRELLKLWLKDAHRTLQEEQFDEIINKFTTIGLPLYLKLAFEEAIQWKSYTKQIKLSPDIPSIIRALFRQLSAQTNHGPLIVARSLGYLVAAKNGLTEDELLDILSRDEKVFRDFIDRSFHKPPEKRLPVIVWSCLYHDLEHYLTERSADNVFVITFYHRELGEVVKEDYLKEDIRLDIHRNLAYYFSDLPFETKTDQIKAYNLRKLSELPYNVQFLKPGMFKDKQEEEALILNTARSLIIVSKNYELELDQHISEIEPIAKWLIELKNHEILLELANNIIRPLEKQCRWPVMQTTLDLALQSASSLKLEEKIVTFEYGISKALFHRGKYSESIEMAEKALKLTENLNLDELEAEILWHLGSMWRFQGNADLAKVYLRKAEEKARAFTDKSIQAKGYFILGIIEHGSGNYDKGLELYTKVLKMGKNKKSRLAIGERFLDMLRIRGDWGYYHEKIEIAQESWNLLEKYAEEMQSIHWLKRVKARLTLLNPDKDFIQMKQAWAESLQEEMMSGELVSAITGHGELAEVCIRRCEFSEAIDLCNKAEKIAQQFDTLHARSGEAYIRGLRLLAKGKIKEAKEQLKKSEEFFIKWTSPYRYWVANALKRLKKLVSNDHVQIL